MTKPVANEVNIVSKGKSVIARPKQNQEVSHLTVIQKLDTMLFEMANLKIQLAQKTDKDNLDALQARVQVLECRNENNSGVDGPRVDTNGDGYSPSTSETTDNINTNDDDTPAVSRLFQTALNLKPYINKTLGRSRSNEGRPRLLCVILNSDADRKEVLVRINSSTRYTPDRTLPINSASNQNPSELNSKECGKKIQTGSIGSDKIIERVETDSSLKNSKHSSSHV